jgi:hypothetical protein
VNKIIVLTSRRDARANVSLCAVKAQKNKKTEVPVAAPEKPEVTIKGTAR